MLVLGSGKQARFGRHSTKWNVIALAQASLKQYSDELQKARAEHDNKGKGRLKGFAFGAVAGILTRLLF